MHPGYTREMSPNQQSCISHKSRDNASSHHADTDTHTRVCEDTSVQQWQLRWKYLLDKRDDGSLEVHFSPNYPHMTICVDLLFQQMSLLLPLNFTTIKTAKGNMRKCLPRMTMLPYVLQMKIFFIGFYLDVKHLRRCLCGNVVYKLHYSWL